VLQVSAAVTGALASAWLALERRVVRRLQRAGATNRAAATERPRWRGPSRWILARLCSVGAVVSNEKGLVYLDETVYATLRKRKAIAGVAIVVLAIATVVLVHAALA